MSRPELNEDAQFIIDTLLERGLFRKPNEVILAALELLFQKQIEDDVEKQKAERGDYSEIYSIQVNEQVKKQTRKQVG